MGVLRFRFSWLLLAAVAAVIFTVVACTSSRRTGSGAGSGQSSTDATNQAMIDRGKYLVASIGCNDCHSPKKLGPQGPEVDTSRMLSGHPENARISEAFKPVDGTPWTIATTDDLTAWSGPWGVSFAANLTPDPNTGLRSGVWTEALFIKAMRTGKHMGTSRDILPPMPWQDFSHLTDEDLRAIWTYVGTIPAVTNHVQDPIPPPAASATR